MKFGKKQKTYKECPRCDTRNNITQDCCTECGLVFSRLDIATNKDAKIKMKRGDKEYIIMTKQLPNDVSFVKLLVLSVCVGLFGGHCFYVGRYWRGITMLTVTSILILFAVLNAHFINLIGIEALGAISSLCGLFLLMWPVDMVLILMKKFKVPIAIDIDSHTEKEEII